MLGKINQWLTGDALPGPVAPCTPNRRPTTSDYYRLRDTLRGTIEELVRRDAEMDRLRELVDLLNAEIKHRNQQLDDLATENQRLHGLLANVPLPPAKPAQPQRPATFTSDTERFAWLEVGRPAT